MGLLHRNLRRTWAFILVFGFVVLLLVPWSTLSLTASADDQKIWKLTWSDEFDGPKGSSVDLTKWSFNIGGSGWGNSELQTYTDRTANARLEDGALVITARKEAYTGAGQDSAQLHLGKTSHQKQIYANLWAVRSAH